MTSTLAAGIVIPVPGSWVPFILGGIALAIIAAFVWDAGKWIGKLGKNRESEPPTPTPTQAHVSTAEDPTPGMPYGMGRSTDPTTRDQHGGTQ